MKVFLRIIKWLAITLVAFGIIAWIAVKVVSEDRPPALAGTDGDALAREMLAAINEPAWDSLKYLKWEFMRGHRYLWDKQDNHAVISWDAHRVVMDLDEVTGVVYTDGTLVAGADADALIQDAWSYWCNDSFWMFAPFKVFDPGTSRAEVAVESGRGLLVSYESGGVTPGDAYLWILGADMIPTGYKMWTFIPIQGIHMTWDGWKTLKGGAKVSQSHSSKMLSFEMKDVAEGSSPSELGYDPSVFEVLD